MIALIADDDLFNRELLARMLKRLGWLTDEASGGIQAVKACESARYDVVLLDLNMPDMNGLEAARRIRAQPDPLETEGSGAKPLRIIAVTGNDYSEGGPEGLFDDFLQKPFVLSELQEKLAK